MKILKRITILISLIVVTATALFFIPTTRDMGMRYLYPKEFESIVRESAQEYGLKEELIFAVIKTESSFDPDAVSRADAKGLMQITDLTFGWIQELLGSEEILSNDMLFDPEINISHGTYFLSFLINYYGNTDTALAAYNAGIGNVDSWLLDERYSTDGETLYDIPFTETKNYVEKVNDTMAIYFNLY